MVKKSTRRVDTDEWDMSEGPEDSRLVVTIEVKSPGGEWVETRASEFVESGTYKLVQV